MNKLKSSIVLCTLSSLTYVTAPCFAAQVCELGTTCPIPGNDGGQTIFKVTPATGTSYMCHVSAKSNGVKFSLTGGKDFNITKGKGLYNANPSVSVEINGRFSHPNQRNDAGEIKLTELPFSSEGTVTCYPVAA